MQLIGERRRKVRRAQLSCFWGACTCIHRISNISCERRGLAHARAARLTCVDTRVGLLAVTMAHKWGFCGQAAARARARARPRSHARAEEDRYTPERPPRPVAGRGEAHLRRARERHVSDGCATRARACGRGWQYAPS